MLLAVLLTLACSTKRSNLSEDKGIGDTRTKPVEFIDNNTFLLTEMSDDKTYGYDKSNPVKVRCT